MSVVNNKDSRERTSRLPDLIRITMLFDHYGNLLADKQREAITLYYFEDQSLGEIAKIQNVSRQAVFDALHHAIDTLEDYEKKLALVQVHEIETKKRNQVLSTLKTIIKEIDNAGIIYDSDKVVEQLRSIENQLTSEQQEENESIR